MLTKQFAFLIVSNPLTPSRFEIFSLFVPLKALKKIEFSVEITKLSATFYSKSIYFIVKFYVAEVHGK
jgi:hypothetical protein